MTLKEEQFVFSRCLAKLLAKMHETHETTMGDVWSKPEYKAHMKNSVHYDRLAADINLFTLEGTYLTDTESHRPFGTYWKSLHPLARWGGDFKSRDANHYSFLRDGRC